VICYIEVPFNAGLTTCNDICGLDRQLF
jgi:hypothetical protein